MVDGINRPGSAGGINRNIGKIDNPRNDYEVGFNPNPASNTSEVSRMQSLMNQERVNSSQKHIVNSVNDYSSKLKQNVDDLNSIMSSPDFSKVKTEDIDNKLQGTAKNMYKSSQGFLKASNINENKQNIASGGINRVMGFVQSTQNNYDQATKMLVKGNKGNPSMSSLMSLTTKMNEANAQMLQIMTVAKQLVDSATKLGNTQF